MSTPHQHMARTTETRNLTNEHSLGWCFWRTIWWHEQQRSNHSVCIYKQGQHLSLTLPWLWLRGDGWNSDFAFNVHVWWWSCRSCRFENDCLLGQWLWNLWIKKMIIFATHIMISTKHVMISIIQLVICTIQINLQLASKDEPDARTKQHIFSCKQ